MKVVKLSFISKSAKEAELIVSDGAHECLAFSQPCEKQLNDKLIEPLHAMDIENLMKVINSDVDEKITRTSKSYFAHYCIAKVVSIEEGIVSVGNIIIQLENKIPGWAVVGDLIEFQCSRLDIW